MQPDVSAWPSALAWVGVVLLLGGECLALRHWRDLSKVLIYSTLAECGFVLIGLAGGELGHLGAGMHVVYQVVMRAMVGLTAWQLVRVAGGWRMDRLTGVGRASPACAVLFAFGMFSLLGLSPFKGALSRFIVLEDLVAHGQWPLAAAVTLASIIAAVYAVRVIQAICFAAPATERAAVPMAWGSPHGLLLILLAAITALINLYPEPVVDVAGVLFGLHAHLPQVDGPWPLLATVPYIGAFVLYGLGGRWPLLRDISAVAIAAATLALTAMAELEPISRLFALLFAVVLFAVTLYSTAYLRHEGGGRRYFFFLFLMIGSLMGVATATDLGSFYLFWELMTWSSYLLIVHSRSADSLKAGALYFVMCSAGAYLMLLGIVGVGVKTGSFEFAGLAQRLSHLDTATGAAFVLCFFGGFAVKAGLVPLHSWLPVAHPAAPSSISAPLSSILTKTGMLGLMKVLLAGFGIGVWTAGPTRWAGFGVMVSVIGVVSLLYGEVMAWRQSDIKRMLAYSTIAQLGEIAAVLGLGGTLAVAGASAHVLAHGLMKTLLFLGAGALIMRTGSRELSDLAGIGRRMPRTVLFMTIGLLAIMGLPPFAGFISKFLMVYASVQAGAVPVAVAMLLGGVIGVLYYGRVIRIICFDPPSALAAKAEEAPLPILLTLGALALMLLVLGLAPTSLLTLAAAAANTVGAARGVAAITLPTMMPHWPLAAVVCGVGGVAILLMGSAGRKPTGAMAMVTLALALAAILYQSARFDALSLAFALVIAVIGLLDLLASIGYFAHEDHHSARFFGVVVLMMGGLIGMAGASDLFSFFFFWEIMSSWTLYFAVVHDETPAALREGFKYFVFNMVGASFLFLGVTVLATSAGSFEFAALAAAAPHLPASSLALGLGAALIGFSMKAAMLTVRVDYQMHPVQAPTPLSGYVSAVLLKSGPLGAFKLISVLGGAAVLSRLGRVAGLDVFSYGLVVIGAVTAFYAGLMAFIQTGVKRLLIYSTVSQIGYVMCGLALGNSLSTAGGLAHAFNHAILKSTLFLAAGAILAQQHVVSLDELGGAGRRMPWTFAMFSVAGLSLSGLPPLNGLGSKWLLYQGALQGGHPFIALALLGASLTTLAAVLKFVHAAFLGAPSPVSQKLREAPVTMLIPMGVLTAVSLAVSLLPGLLLVPVSHIQTALGLAAIQVTWFGPLPGPGGWHPLAIGGPLLVLLGIGWVLMRAGRPQVTASHAHTCGVALAPGEMRVKASNLFASPGQLVRRVLWIQAAKP